MSYVEDQNIVVTELPDVPVDATFRTLLTAYTAEGYEQGYARGTRDLLSLYPLLIQQYLHAHDDVTPTVRNAIRAFGLYVEEHVSKHLDDAGFVEDGLGI